VRRITRKLNIEKERKKEKDKGKTEGRPLIKQTNKQTNKQKEGEDDGGGCHCAYANLRAVEGQGIRIPLDLPVSGVVAYHNGAQSLDLIRLS
jgi:hypothetical protein